MHLTIHGALQLVLAASFFTSGAQGSGVSYGGRSPTYDLKYHGRSALCP